MSVSEVVQAAAVEKGSSDWKEQADRAVKRHKARELMARPGSLMP